MYKLNDASNDATNYFNLYNLNLPKRINQIHDRRNSFDSSKFSKKSLYSKQKVNNNENSLNKIQKIKDIMPKQNNSNNKNKEPISLQGNNFPIFLSFMTNSNNAIHSINKKFRVRNFSNYSENKTVSDNNSFIINNNSIFENKNQTKNILNLKKINNKKSKVIKKIMSTINFSINKNKNFFDENTNNMNSSVNIKNYNYFIGNIDKSLNIYESKEIFKKREKIQKIPKLKEKDKLKNIKLSEITKPKINIFNMFNNTNFKLNLPKKKLQNVLTKKLNLNLNTSVDNDIINKETSINDSKINLKVKTSSKMVIPKLDNKINTPIIKQELIKKISDKNLDKFGISGLYKIKQKIENNDTDISIINKKFKKSIPFAYSGENRTKKDKMDHKETMDNKEKKEKKSILVKKKKKNANRKSSKLERNIQKRILDLQKKSKQTNNIKFFDIIVDKQNNKFDEKTNKFLSKLISNNDSEEKQKLKKYVKDNKIRIILNKKNSIDKFISRQSEKMKLSNFNFFSKYADILSIKKSIISNKDKIILHKSTYISFQKNSTLNIFLYSYISFINKCSLDINLKSFIFTNLDFSSISLPQVEQDNSFKTSLLLSGIHTKRNVKKKEIFSTVKTKFIESNKYQYHKSAQISSLNFITKELDFYNILKSVNFLENENNGDNIRKGENSNSNMSSPMRMTSILKRKKSANYSRKKMKFPTRSNIKLNTHQQNSLSILEDKNFFKKENTKIVKKFRNSINANLFWYKLSTKKNFDKILPRVSVNIDINLQKEYQIMNKVITLIRSKKFNKDLSYNKYDLLKQIKGKENIESILRLFIIEGEAMLFIEYFNNVIKKIDINSKDGQGNTFLILSVKSGMNYISKILLEKGVDVNIQNLEGNSALHYALSRKNFEIADLLKKFGAHEDLMNKRGFSPWECLGKSIENSNQ